ncbi:MAG: MBL fold metallo-hydrolase, partial [Chloroflexi bacterium]|nr:MBL fold metallo-hydrolase [Chloroflexota bacterium]
MEITVLGAHHLETSSSWLAGLLVDGALALDAGSLSSGLTLEEQKRVKAILITHHHFDHVKDLPLIGLATGHDSTKEVCAPERTLQFVRAHLLDGDIYPRMDEWPSVEKPSFRLRALEALQQVEIAGYRVKPVQVKHGAVFAVGYEVASREGSTLFYTGDTGGELSSCWQHTSPTLLALEVSLPDSHQDTAQRAGHLTPS